MLAAFCLPLQSFSASQSTRAIYDFPLQDFSASLSTHRTGLR
jgi:hypothetical protein